MVLGKLDIHIQKNKREPVSYTIHKNELKWIKFKPETIKLLEENIGEKLLDIGLGSDFFGYDSKNISNKGKSKHLGPYQTESTENSQPNEKAPIKWKEIFIHGSLFIIIIIVIITYATQ